MKKDNWGLFEYVFSCGRVIFLIAKNQLFSENRNYEFLKCKISKISHHIFCIWRSNKTCWAPLPLSRISPVPYFPVFPDEKPLKLSNSNFESLIAMLVHLFRCCYDDICKCASREIGRGWGDESPTLMFENKLITLAILWNRSVSM